MTLCLLKYFGLNAQKEYFFYLTTHKQACDKYIIRLHYMKIFCLRRINQTEHVGIQNCNFFSGKPADFG